MLVWRLTLGPLFIAAIAALCWLDYNASLPGIFLLPLAVVLSLLGAAELLAMFRHRDPSAQPLAWVVYTGTLLTVFAASAPALLPVEWSGGSAVGRLGWLAIGLAAGLLLAIVGELRRYESPGRATTNLALAVFGIAYMGGLMGFIVQLRLLTTGPTGADSRLGMLALVSLITTVKMSDIGQYTAGRLFGRRKLSPKVSPGKTWEGVAGGIVFAIVAACLVLRWGSPFILGTTADHAAEPAKVPNHIAIALFAVSVAVAGIVGDLAESMLKRDAGVKDSSTWMPGFGGVLDLLDSLLGAAPVAYLFWALKVVGP